MPYAKFEEKQYETAANIEFACSGNNVFSSGQVLESIVGYDAAIQITEKRVCDLIGCNMPPGIFLSPALWGKKGEDALKKEQLPGHLVSLLLQYKRPEYITRKNGKQWSKFNKPYFRMNIEDEQHDILLNLENKLSDKAQVRYATPVFWRYDELQKNMMEKKILNYSKFVSPNGIGKGHSCWVYTNKFICGYANPDYKQVYFDSFDYLLRKAKSISEKSTFAEHIDAMAKKLRVKLVVKRRMPDGIEVDENNAPEWIHSLLNIVEIEALQTVYNFFEIGNIIARAGASWQIVGF
jgi:hypothetical protein